MSANRGGYAGQTSVVDDAGQSVDLDQQDSRELLKAILVELRMIRVGLGELIGIPLSDPGE